MVKGTRSAEAKAIASLYCLVDGCGQTQSEPFTDLCAHHGLTAYRQAKSFLATVDEVWHEPRESQVSEPKSVVYYARFGAFIKIGTTINLTERLGTLKAAQPDYELLATEPGDRLVERERHKQFAACRQPRSELFAPTPALQQHIRSLQAA